MSRLRKLYSTEVPSANCERHRLSRASEVFNKRHSRLTADRMGHKLSGASKVYTEQESRLIADCESRRLYHTLEVFTEWEIKS